MTASMLRRRVLGLQRPPVLLSRLPVFATLWGSPLCLSFSSTRRPRGFANVLRFATIQPWGGEVTPVDFQRKAALVVNTASKCSHAGQLKDLQTLHEKYSDRGLVVVAVPSNDFAGQEPGDKQEVLQRYVDAGVTFVVAEKTAVSGEKAHPFYKKIADKYSASVAPTWNFDKFLVDHRGDMRAVFPNDTEPLVKEVIAEIEEVLDDLPLPGQEVEEEYDYEEEDSDEEDSDDEEQDEDSDDEDDDGEERKR
ncbi:unnamed protein product [Phytophthora lilii]|uniref:Glutathione peroxidase n=1 Tax=Phytophthora lilii TaxID=2077276 RepID=A0A9W6XE22_9STRA|nr:unnamed protein product [Phytophthora lilii]